VAAGARGCAEAGRIDYGGYDLAPADEVVFFRFRAATPDAVRPVSERARIPVRADRRAGRDGTRATWTKRSSSNETDHHHLPCPTRSRGAARRDRGLRRGRPRAGD